MTPVYMVFKKEPNGTICYVTSFTDLNECIKAISDLSLTKLSNTEYFMMNGQRYG